MKKLKPAQDGFIPMMIVMMAVLIAAIVLVYLHVQKSR